VEANPPKIRKGDCVRYWPGLRTGRGFLSVAKSNITLLHGDTPGVYLNRHDKDGHMDFIALTHVEPYWVTT